MKSMAVRALAAVFSLTGGPALVAGAGFLVHGGGEHAVHLGLRSAELQAAMASVLGCGSAAEGEEATKADTAEVERALGPIWRALPKNPDGRPEWKQLRYLAHRYFSQRSSFVIRGLEPSRQVNASDLGAADILSEQIPALLEMLLGKHALILGYSFEDAVATILALEHVILNSETTLLEQVYKNRHFTLGDQLHPGELKGVLEEYMIHWMLGEGYSAETMAELVQNHSLLEESVPHWREISNFVQGAVDSMSYAHQHSPKESRGMGKKAMSSQLSFEDASAAVGSVGKSFASFWETECQVIKASLVEMDRAASGRVKLSDFYGANLDGEWRFGESEAYLRELGALDESSTWRGPQVIIPNYLQAACNCIVARPHYLVCCVNECEGILGDVEREIGAPTAEPGEILQIVGNMSNYDDEPVKLDKALRNQLQQIAENGPSGRVPLHGRLFAQWLHYVFPRECPFPHKAGAKSASVTPSQYGDDFFVTEDEVARHVSAGKELAELNDTFAGDAWMSQWNTEEELLGDYSQFRSLWEGRQGLARGFSLLGALALALLALRGAAESSAACALAKGFASGLPKAHFV
jgi:hypothetical protein